MREQDNGKKARDGPITMLDDLLVIKANTFRFLYILLLLNINMTHSNKLHFQNRQVSGKEKSYSFVLTCE